MTVAGCLDMHRRLIEQIVDDGEVVRCKVPQHVHIGRGLPVASHRRRYGAGPGKLSLMTTGRRWISLRRERARECSIDAGVLVNAIALIGKEVAAADGRKARAVARDQGV